MIKEIINYSILYGGLLLFAFVIMPYFFNRMVKSLEPKKPYKKKTNKPLATAVKCGVGWQGYTGGGLWGTSFKTGTCKTLKECKGALEIQGYEVRVHRLV